MLGVRYIGLNEDLTITQTSEPTGGVATLPFAGQTGFNRVTATDNFHTRNEMWGGQIGGRYEVRRGLFYGTLTGKVAMGPNKQTSSIEGFSTATGPAVAPAAFPSGVLALQGANARHENTQWFAVSPEVGVQIGVQLSCSVRDVHWLRMRLHQQRRPPRRLGQHEHQSALRADQRQTSARRPARMSRDSAPVAMTSLLRASNSA